MKNHNLKRRLFHAVGATSLGPALTAAIQLVSVPIFLHFWGPKLYGEWLVLSAIPIYLGFTDFGFGSVAGSEMTMLVARGAKDAALEVFQSTWLLTTGVSVSFGLCVALGLGVLPVERWLNIAVLSRGQVTAILCALCAYVLLDMQWTVIAAGFKSDGNYALGALMGNIVRFCTNACSVAAVAFHGSPLTVAIILVCFRFLGNWACQFVLTRKSPWLHYGYRHAHLSVIRRLFGPAIAFMAFPAGNAFILQGMTVLVGAVLGPIAVVMYSTVRTLTRFVYQTVDMITNGVWAEMSTALGAGNISLARNLHRCACQASLGLSLAAASFLALFGKGIYGVWTHHKITLDHALFYVLLIEVLANALWFTSSIVPIAWNRHQRQALVYVSATLASLPIAYFLMKWIGLPGAGISLLMVDLCMIGYVLTGSLRLLHDKLNDFVLALFRPPTLGVSRSETGD
jgi:O-antigen/teichoic acid export membrane protein